MPEVSDGGLIYSNGYSRVRFRASAVLAALGAMAAWLASLAGNLRSQIEITLLLLKEQGEIRKQLYLLCMKLEIARVIQKMLGYSPS